MVRMECVSIRKVGILPKYIFALLPDSGNKVHAVLEYVDQQCQRHLYDEWSCRVK